MENKAFNVQQGEKELSEYAYAKREDLIVVVLPSSVFDIREKAFAHCVNLQRIYIPASVLRICENAFLGCPKLEIFCEGDVGVDWVDKEVTHYATVYSDEDDAFNFHRSSGSWNSHTVEEKRRLCWNPDNRPVHTNVTREQFDQLNKKQ